MGDLIPIATPVGELHWVNISGQGKENYNEDGYNYVSTVRLAGQAAKDTAAKIDEVLGPIPMETVKGKQVPSKIVKSLGYRPVFKDAEGEFFVETANRKAGDGDTKTDMVDFTFTTGTTFADGKQKKVGVYNCSSPPQKVSLGDKKVGNGSKGAISGKMQRFERGKEIGVSLFLNAIQLTKFTEYVDDAGFEGQEGDFIGTDDEESGFIGTPEKGSDETASAAKSSAKPRL